MPDKQLFARAYYVPMNKAFLLAPGFCSSMEEALAEAEKSIKESCHLKKERIYRLVPVAQIMEDSQGRVRIRKS